MKIFEWIKTAYKTLTKKDLVTQDKINPVYVKKFADRIDGWIKFDKMLDGKFAWVEKYDGWAILQLLNLFISMMKFKPSFWISFEQVLIYLDEGNTQQASFILTKEINPVLKSFIPKDAQEIALRNQVNFVFELTAYYIERGDAVNA